MTVRVSDLLRGRITVAQRDEEVFRPGRRTPPTRKRARPRDETRPRTSQGDERVGKTSRRNAGNPTGEPTREEAAKGTKIKKQIYAPSSNRCDSRAV